MKSLRLFYFLYIPAEHLLEMAQSSKNGPELALAINDSDLASFLFPDDFIQKLFDIVHKR